MEKSLALPVFHCFTGCDTTSTFFGWGKRASWEVWKCYDDVTHAFTYMALHPFADVNIHSTHFQVLEQFTVFLYDKTSDVEHVNEARKVLFCQKERTMEKLPPTQDALLQHTKRVAYQAGIWCSSSQSMLNAPSPEGWGWTITEEKTCIPVWNTLPLASKACSELVKCACKSASGCGTRCACKKAGWNCTELCKCHCLTPD